MPLTMQMGRAVLILLVCSSLIEPSQFVVYYPNLRFAPAVDKGTDWIVGSCPTDVELSPVPWLHQTDKVCTLLLETQRQESIEWLKTGNTKSKSNHHCESASDVVLTTLAWQRGGWREIQSIRVSLARQRGTRTFTEPILNLAVLQIPLQLHTFSFLAHQVDVNHLS